MATRAKRKIKTAVTNGLTNREWLEYWRQVDADRAPMLAELADQVCDLVGGTRREFIEERESGRLAQPFDNPTAEAAVEAGFLTDDD